MLHVKIPWDGVLVLVFVEKNASSSILSGFRLSTQECMEVRTFIQQQTNTTGIQLYDHFFKAMSREDKNTFEINDFMFVLGNICYLSTHFLPSWVVLMVHFSSTSRRKYSFEKVDSAFDQGPQYPSRTTTTTTKIPMAGKETSTIGYKVTWN